MSQAKSNKMGVVQLTILTMVNMMGSGIIMLPTKLAEVGTISIISWLVTAVGSMALAWAFAKCGMFSRKSGGMGGYAEYAFGKSGNLWRTIPTASRCLIATSRLLFGGWLRHRTARREFVASADWSCDHRGAVDLYRG